MALGVASGCSVNSNGNFVSDPPRCRIVSQSDFKPKSPGTFSTITYTIENDGTGGTAYNVGVSVKLKSGNTIVDNGTVYAGTLESGESISKDVWFTSIKSSSEYGSAVVKLSWYDYDGGYYESSQ